MSKQKRTWILVKSSEYRPGGALSLGQILTKPFEPSLPLLPDGLYLPETAVERSHQASVDLTTSTSVANAFNIWAKVVLLPIKPERRANESSLEDVSWHFERLDTEIMVPRLLDVQAAMSTEEVVAQINRNKFDFRKRLYMVTGVRIARGAKLSQQTSKATGGGVKGGVDFTLSGMVPVSVGAAKGWESTKSTGYSFDAATDFIYAYRLCEIHYGKDVFVKPFNKGDTFGVDSSEDEGSSEDEDDTDEQQHRILIEGIDVSDYTESGVPHQTFSLPLRDGEESEDEFIISS
ncbi:hypothetical protein V494_08333 [Pseudogymnoascus sp. VKM F-4513 (FW-928)]|nr:hypothetical protein V494_08333 [Pseudogymnoascus sp. VKM F-4513 (FW-928)]